jgi:hypothetical protein
MDPIHAQTAEIHVGMSYAKAQSLLRGIGALDSPFETQWGFTPPNDGQTHDFIFWGLPDNTVVSLYCAGPSKRAMTIKEIHIGPKGKGFRGTRTWFKENRSVDRLILIEDAFAPN